MTLPERDSESRADDIADRILSETGGDVRLGLPLGLGKPVTLVNALTRRVARTPSAKLSILTALTLERPDMSGGMAQRFLEPAADRLFGRYPGLEYARMMRDGTLPDNIEVSEFFMQAGRWLSVPLAQRRYIAANYTHAADVLCDWRPNVVMQLVGEAPDGTLSLSCNTDITADLVRFRHEGRQSFLFVAEVNRNLPALTGPEASVAREEADLLHDSGDGFDLFCVPKRPVGNAEHAIGLHVSRLVADGGTLQIGIGAIGDAVANALILRQRGETAPIHAASPFAPDAFGEDGPFETGLYSVTEMLVDGLLRLFEAGIVRREVDGAAIHAGFFADCADFYRRLRDMPEDRRRRIQMMPVSFTNALYGDETGKRAARTGARFVNAAMKATLLGGLVSDAAESGKEVSGIGGQFNFIEQAFALEDARSVITVPATRRKQGETVSNIVWSHPHESVPRAYRDIVVTEYGIADLRGRPDEEAVAAMLRIADSRFQDQLLDSAKNADKIAADFRIPPAWRQNTPETLKAWLAPFDLPDFPFGSDFTDTEQRLLPAMALLSATAGGRREMARLLLSGLTAGNRWPAQMERMGLDSPGSLKERLEALALRGALARTEQNAG